MAVRRRAQADVDDEPVVTPRHPPSTAVACGSSRAYTCTARRAPPTARSPTPQLPATLPAGLLAPVALALALAAAIAPLTAVPLATRGFTALVTCAALATVAPVGRTAELTRAVVLVVLVFLVLVVLEAVPLTAAMLLLTALAVERTELVVVLLLLALVVVVRATADVLAPTATVPVTVARPSAMQSLTKAAEGGWAKRRQGPVSAYLRRTCDDRRASSSYHTVSGPETSDSQL